MYTHDVPTENWSAFLDAFTRLHRGDPVDLEIVGGGAPPRSPLCECPLVAIVALSDCGQGACFEVVAGELPHVEAHTIRCPSHVSVTEAEDGQPMALQITAEDGSVTSLRFEPPNRSTKPSGNYLG